MARGTKYAPEQIVSILRQIEVAVSNGKTTAEACREAAITEETYYRRLIKYGGLKVDQVRRLKALEQENVQLKRLVAELSLEKIVLRDLVTAEVFRPHDGANTSKTRPKKHGPKSSSLASRPMQQEDGASSC
jgi:putative transposase